MKTLFIETGTEEEYEKGATSCCGLYKCNTDVFMTAMDKVIQ